MKKLFKAGLFQVVCVTMISGSGEALAATGTITLTVNGSGQAPLTKSTNISGPTFLRGKGSFTASFTSATVANGYISADLTDTGYESLCDNTFSTVITNGICRVVLGSAVSGQGHSSCTYSLGPVNTQTCDFTASFIDTPGAGSGPPH